MLVYVHEYIIEDERGDAVDVLPFCSDFCHRDYCERSNNPYAGWNGLHEIEGPVECSNCGNEIGVDDEPYGTDDDDDTL